MATQQVEVFQCNVLGKAKYVSIFGGFSFPVEKISSEYKIIIPDVFNASASFAGIQSIISSSNTATIDEDQQFSKRNGLDFSGILRISQYQVCAILMCDNLTTSKVSAYFYGLFKNPFNGSNFISYELRSAQEIFTF